MKYDLRVENWINAIDMSGNLIQISLEDLLKNAHNLKELRGCDDVDMSEFDLYRFLCTLCMYMYKNELKSDSDKIRIYRNGMFDPEMIDSFFNACEKDGVSFDLLDENRPFLQCSKELFLEMGVKLSAKKLINESNVPIGAAALSHRIPTATNSIFCTKNGIVGNAPIPLSDYAYYLIHLWGSRNGFGGGYHNSPCGGDGISVLLCGENVFDNIILNCVPVPENATKPMWYGFPDCSNFKDVNILNGMMWTPVLIYPDFSSVKEKDKTIQMIYRISAMKYDPLEEFIKLYQKVWETQFEPHFVMREEKNKRVRLNPSNQIGLFKMCEIIGFSDEDINVIPQLDNILRSKNIKFYMENIEDLFDTHIDIYSMRCKQAVLLSSIKVRNEIPVSYIVKDVQNVNFVSDFVNKVNNAVDVIKKKASKNKRDIAIRSFTEYAENLFRSILDRMIDGEIISEEDAKEYYCMLKKEAVLIYRKCEFSNSHVIEYAAMENNFEIGINKKLFPKVKK